MNQNAHNMVDEVQKRKHKSSSRLGNLGLIFLFLCGFLIAAYPTISNELAKRNTIQALEEYKAYSANLSEEELKTEWDAARVYNDNLAGDPVRDPFVPYSGMALPENYMEVLNPAENEIMGYLEIPSVKIQLMFAHGTSDEVLEKYAGHIEQTSLPIGGKNSHAVLTAHTGLPSARLFTDLIGVKEEDRFYIYILDEMLTYRVDQIEVISPDEVEKLRIVAGKDYVTLLTCTPYGINSHRLLVRGERIPNEETVETAGGMVGKDFNLLWLALVPLPVLFLWQRKRKQKKRREERTV